MDESNVNGGGDGGAGDSQTTAKGSLTRQVGVIGAVMLGLGSIVGTGVFVSTALGAAAAGSMVLLAIAIAAVLAMCNGLSSAQLAANYPVSGGTYEYGYRLLNPSLGFTAGWMFLTAKSASAATAALGFAAYLMQAFGIDHRPAIIAMAIVGLVLLTGIVLSGLRRTSTVNMVIVGITLAALLVFVGGALSIGHSGTSATQSADIAGQSWGVPGLLEACALMFVAYTGYGRVATLGEEITNPRRNIPIAVVVTLLVTAGLYLLVTSSAVHLVGVEVFASLAEDGAPLEESARLAGLGTVAMVLVVGAITAMLGVLLNLILGLSRVALAMGRRGDLPSVFGSVNASGSTPTPAVLLVAGIIFVLVLFGSIKLAWSLSAFTVLIYYALTNLSALRLSKDQRLYPRIVSVLGLAGCLFLAWWVEPVAWIIGLSILAVGLVWHVVRRKLTQHSGPNPV